MTLQPRLEFAESPAASLQQPSLRQQAVALRMQGKTYAQIKEALGIRSNSTVTAFVRGVPGARTHIRRSPEELAVAKARAIEMRLEGRSYNEITAATGIKRGTLSAWLRDIHLTDEQRAELTSHSVQSIQAGAAANRQRRLAKTKRLIALGAAEIGPVTDRELFLMGVVAYWCEGTKEKPWNPGERVKFINQDPRLVELFICFLEGLGYAREELHYRVAIHETADVDRATEFWSAAIAVDGALFRPPTIKRHRSKKPIRNPDDYVGCLVVAAPCSTDLNRRMAGWYQGIREALRPTIGPHGRG